MTMVYTYLTYLIISIALTVWVGRTLFRSGRVFLVDVFAGNEALANSVNHLLVVGFFLINLGYVSLVLKMTEDVSTTRQTIEALTGKLGLVLLVLGAMHFFNIGVLNHIRSNRISEKWQGAVPPPYPAG